MEREESKISVWVCREEKLVSGLSRRTTCAEVIRVLLEEQSLAASARSYCIVEKWRGSERVLPPKTRILRLWSAWGDEQENVRFVLVRSEASLAGGAPRSAEARVVLSRESPRACRAPSGPSLAALSRERQRRIVRKAFRKLERMNRRRARAVAKDARSAERMETLVHVVVSQDHTIRQQIRRLEELDDEIERHEARVHLDRVRAHGANYVQDTYLVGAEQDEERAAGACEDGLAPRLEEYAHQCDELLRLHDEVSEREALAASLTRQIEEELNRRWMERRRGETPVEPQAEEERVRTELDASLYIGLRLSTDLEEVSNELDTSQEVWETRDKELRDLLEKVDSLDLEEEEEDAHVCIKDPGVSSESAWLEQARGLSKTCSSNDDDSDTGLSSMHSQDSDSALVCESLV